MKKILAVVLLCTVSMHILALGQQEQDEVPVYEIDISDPAQDISLEMELYMELDEYSRRFEDMVVIDDAVFLIDSINRRLLFRKGDEEPRYITEYGQGPEEFTGILQIGEYENSCWITGLSGPGKVAFFSREGELISTETGPFFYVRSLSFLHDNMIILRNSPLLPEGETRTIEMKNGLEKIEYKPQDHLLYAYDSLQSYAENPRNYIHSFQPALSQRFEIDTEYSFCTKWRDLLCVSGGKIYYLYSPLANIEVYNEEYKKIERIFLTSDEIERNITSLSGGLVIERYEVNGKTSRRFEGVRYGSNVKDMTSEDAYLYLLAYRITKERTIQNILVKLHIKDKTATVYGLNIPSGKWVDSIGYGNGYIYALVDRHLVYHAAID